MSVWKRFGTRDVVQDVSFTLESGKVVGLVGPNGAGKTTSIRIALGIIPPDQGEVVVLGRPLDEAAKERIGYLPEERGLYRGRRVLPTLAYLGELRGLERQQALRRAEELLERVGMAAHRHRKVSELSHGMAQLIQFTAAIIHRPAVVVLDEPFNALDPVNVRLMKDIILELRHDGAALVLSTHQMNLVEELCDNVVMINGGRVVLEGPLAEVRRRFRGDLISVVCASLPAGLHGVTNVRREGAAYVMRLLPEATPEQVLRQLLDQGAGLERFELATPSMEEIFITVVRGSHA